MPLTDIYRGQEDNTVFSIRSSESGGGRVILTSNFEDIRAGWFEGDVALTIPGFSALFSSEFQAEGLQSFLASLIKMDETLNGEAEFVTVEPGIAIYGEMRKRGRIYWKMNARYPVGSQTSLEFVIENDQSHLPGTIAELRRSLRRLALG
jgi:hypothetical protein